MALPGFYNQGDQEIYASGDKFIPQERYRLGYTHPPSATQEAGAAGITNTNVAQPFIWPPQGGGGGSGGGGLYGNLDLGKTKDFMKNVYVDQGPKKGWQKQTVTGYYNPTLGNYQTLKGKNINHLGIEVPGLFTSILNKMSGQKFGEPQVGDIQGTFTKDPSGDIEEEEAVYKAALHRNRINKIISSGIYKKDYVPTGGDRHPDGPIDKSGGKAHPDAPTKTPEQGGWHPGVGGNGNQGSQPGSMPTGTAGKNPWGRAQGGRIGYRTAGPVFGHDEPSEPILEFMQDQNIPYSPQVEGGPTEEQIAMVIDMDSKGIDMDTISSVTELGKEVILNILGVELAQGGIARLL